MDLTEPRPPRPKRFRAFGASALLSLWFVGLLVIGASLMTRHVLALPAPSTVDVGMSRSLQALDASDPRGPLARDEWSAFHVLYAECLCSQRVADALATGERPDHVRDTVLFIGHDEAIEGPLVARGFRVEEVSAASLAEEYGVQAAPLLILRDPSGAVRYSGGYTETKQALAIRDRAILRQLRSNAAVTTLPVWGCAVSADLRARTNPLGLP